MTNPSGKTTGNPEASTLARYDWQQSYDWNYEHAPAPVTLDEPPVPGVWNYCGLPVNSPLGIAAGPLLNGRWILYYASLGFDVLTYKTVRSRHRACYPMPNLQNDPRLSEPPSLPGNAGNHCWPLQRVYRRRTAMSSSVGPDQM